MYSIETKESKRAKYPQNSTVKGRFYYQCLKKLIANTAAFLWLKKVNGLENIPQEGAFLLVPNHQTYLDFMLLISALKQIRRLVFFIKKPYFDIPLWKFFLVPMGDIRADGNSIATAIKLLVNENLPVVLFAEGTRTKTGKVGNAYPGFIKIASEIPTLKVIPVGIKGAFDLWPCHLKFPKFSGRKVIISIGRPIKFCEFVDNKNEINFSKIIMERIEQLAK